MSLCLPALPETLKGQKGKMKIKYSQHILQKYRTSILDKIQANSIPNTHTGLYLKDPRKINNRSKASLLVSCIRHIAQSFALGTRRETDGPFSHFVSWLSVGEKDSPRGMRSCQ